MKIYFLIYLLTFPLIGKSKSNKDINPKILAQNNVLKIAPFSLLNPIYPNIRFSYERKLNNRFSMQLDYGKIFKKNYNFSPDKNKGFLLGIENRFYFNKKALNSFYLSLGYRYFYSLYTEVDNFGTTDIIANPPQVTDYIDTFKVRSIKNYFELKFGKQFIIKNHFVFDYNIGFQQKFQNISNMDRQNLESVSKRAWSIFQRLKQDEYMPTQQGDFNFITSFRIGYIF